jgi:hypothetical protein
MAFSFLAPALLSQLGKDVVNGVLASLPVCRPFAAFKLGLQFAG